MPLSQGCRSYARYSSLTLARACKGKRKSLKPPSRIIAPIRRPLRSVGINRAFSLSRQAAAAAVTSISPHRMAVRPWKSSMLDESLASPLVFGPGKTFQKRSVSSPAPVTIVWPSGDIAR